MEIPPKIRIPLCIEQGSVFNFLITFDDPKRQSKNRYFVILNSNPKNNVTLIMVTSTTQKQKRREFARKSGIDEGTIIEVKANEYCIFKNDSVFDCNDVFEVKIEDLVRKIEENGSMNYPKLPEKIIRQIIAGVNKSPKISPEIKKLI